MSDRALPQAPFQFTPLVLALSAGLTLGVASARAQEQAPEQPQSALQPAAEEGAEDEMISFGRFAEPISLAALIDFVAEQLNIIILQTDAATLAGATVEFSAPIDVPRSELLSLLETLLAPKGFALVRTPQGVYLVTPVADAPVDFGEGAFAPTRVIKTPLITPSSLQPIIESALGTTASGSKIVYLDSLGVIISTAPPRINRAIIDVIDHIGQEIRTQQLHRIELDHIAAAEAKARVLELTGQSRVAAPGAAVQGAAPAASAAGALGNLSERLLVDRPTNALIFRGAAAEAEVVAGFVEIVDVPSRLIVRRYYAGPTANEIAQVGERKGLGPILQAGPSTQGAAGRPVAGEFGSGFVLSAADSESFTYYGTENQHAQVQELVDEFASQAREETFIVEFYKLRNVAAEETAELLTSLMDIDTSSTTANSPFLPGSLDRRSQRGIDRLALRRWFPTRRRAPGQVAGADTGATTDEGSTLTPTEGVAVIADIPNNQLIIRAPRRQQREFARIIDNLDQRRPQVYIEVKIVSINASRDFNFSVDTAITSPNSDVPIFTNFGLVPYGSVLPIPNSTEGITAAVIRNDYTPIVINALTTVADGELISSPKILVNDNEEAELESVREEPFSSTSQVAGAPSITSTGGTLSAGTTLSVRPTISENGTLRLEYSIELSSFGERPSPDLPPVRLADSFTSIVTVPSDSTVVIGGLTLDSRDSTVAKVPFLGSIPLIGWAFQDQSRMKSARTVYVFLTPRVLRDDTFNDLRLLTRGPLDAVELEHDTPPLLPAIMSVIDRLAPGEEAM